VRPNPTATSNSPDAQTDTPRVSAQRPVVLDPAQIATWLFETFHSPHYRPPVLPRVAVQLLELTRDPHVKVRDVANLLERDAMLTAVTMRAANSAVHRGSSEIYTLEEAIARMGLRRVTDLFLETAVNTRVFLAPGYEPVMDMLRGHSAAVAHVARMGSRFTGLDPGHAFLCGLLHDIGIAAGFIAIGEQYDLSGKPTTESVWSAVLQHHAAAGKLIQQSWALPDEVGEVLANHHVQASSSRLSPMACLVALSDALVSDLGAKVLNETASGTIEVTSARLGIDDHTLRKITSNASTIVTNLLSDSHQF